MIYRGDVMEGIPLRDGSVQCVVTSPPYWGLRDYGVPGQLGLEAPPEEYVAKMVGVFREVWRVMRDDGTLWLNLGDSYSSGNRKSRVVDKKNTHRVMNMRPVAPDYLKPKDLVGIPWMVAFALRAEGWCLRSDIVWAKANPMPESVRDRPTRAHEYLFLLTKGPKYYYDAAAIREPAVWADEHGTGTGVGWGKVDAAVPGGGHKKDPSLRVKGDKQRGYSRRHAGFNERWDGMTRVEQQSNGRNKRSVWHLATQPYPGAHFAVMPEALVLPCILAGSRVGDVVYDPFVGSGTVVDVAEQYGRLGVGGDLNGGYCRDAASRCSRSACRQGVIY